MSTQNRNKNQLPPISSIQTQTLRCLLMSGPIMHAVQRELFEGNGVRVVLQQDVIMQDALAWDRWGFLDVCAKFYLVFMMEFCLLRHWPDRKNSRNTEKRLCVCGVGGRVIERARHMLPCAWS